MSSLDSDPHTSLTFATPLKQIHDNHQNEMKEELDLKSKDKLPLPSKRPSKKKPKDKPKRPLSAYNFFFKEEREKILRVVLADDPDKAENNPESDDYLDEEMLKRLRKEGGKVSFEEMGKLIGQRWKNIEGDNLTRFSELATEDTERYKKEMADYNGRQEQKMRNEALKPSAPAFSRADMSKGNMDPSRGGYPDSSGYGNPAMGGYPGYGFGYGMGMEGMYAPPYGYPGMGGPMGPDMGRMEGGQYGGPPPMYGMMGGYPMGYGPGPEGYGPPPPGQQPPMDPSGGPPPMYGYGPPSGWGHQ